MERAGDDEEEERVSWDGRGVERKREIGGEERGGRRGNDLFHSNGRFDVFGLMDRVEVPGFRSGKGGGWGL